MVDVENGQLVEALLDQHGQGLDGDLIARLGEDLARRRIIEVLRQILAVEILGLHLDRLHALLGELARGAHGELLAGLDQHLARIRVDDVVDRLHALQALGIERLAPAVAGGLVDDGLVEGGENLLAVETEREQQRRHRNLAATVDARIDDVLGVELDVEPGAAIGNDARREQQLAGRVALALVVIEEHARRAVHLRDDDALGAIDDEGAVRRHEGHVAHIDVLLLDVLDRLRLRVGIDVEHDEAQRHFQRRGEGHAALSALVDVIFRRLELVAHEFEQRDLREVGDREDGFEHRLQPLVGTPALRLVDEEKLVVGGLLHFDQIGHLRGFANMSEEFADTLATGESLRRRLSHVASRFLLGDSE